MSFYGNSFYYTAESFARIVLQNSGLNKYITTLPDEDPFTEVPSNDEVKLDAPQRSSGLGIQSGNHWIKLATSGNTFQILHAAPGYDNDDNTTYTTIQGCVVEDEEPSKDLAKPVLMDWGKTIIVPMITYDATGHIIPTNDTTYLQMPADPTAEMEGRMSDIEDRMDDIDGDDEDSLKSQLNAAIDNLEEAKKDINSATQSAEAAKGSADAAKESAEAAKGLADAAAEQAKNASDTALTLGSTLSIYALKADLDALVKRVEALEQANTIS